MENLICVDTDIIIDHLIGKGTGVKTFERIIKKEIPFTTHINRFELLCGARNDKEVEIINECLLGFTILPFDEPSSHEAARVYRELKAQGNLVGVRDILIAGIALANDLIFATKNVKDFKNVQGLKILDV